MISQYFDAIERGGHVLCVAKTSLHTTADGREMWHACLDTRQYGTNQSLFTFSYVYI
jgi:hypothetical protein